MRKYFGHKSAALWAVAKLSPHPCPQYLWIYLEIFWKDFSFGQTKFPGTCWIFYWVWHVFHLKFSKASNWSTNYISTTSDDQIWPDSYRKISVCLAKVLCVHKTVEKLNTGTKVVLCIASTFAPPMPEVAPLQQFGVVFLVSNLWQCWHLGQPNSGQSRVTPNHRHYKSPKTSRRTPFCHNPNLVAIMAMTNRPQQWMPV